MKKTSNYKHMVLKQTKSNYNGSNGNYKVRISRCEAAQQADARSSLSLAVTVLRSRGGLARIANWIIKLFRVCIEIHTTCYKYDIFYTTYIGISIIQ